MRLVHVQPTRTFVGDIEFPAPVVCPDGCDERVRLAASLKAWVEREPMHPRADLRLGASAAWALDWLLWSER